MIPKQAVEKAIEEGWGRMKTADPKRREGLIREALKIQERLSLDPTFWQALFPTDKWTKNSGEYKYLEQAHRFYDLILTNQPTEPFWDNILK